MEDIVFHVKFEGETQDPEIFCLRSDTKWMDLEAMLKAQFDCQYVQIFYIDPEGDYIVVSSQEELQEAFRIAGSCGNTIHLVVRDLGNDDNDNEDGKDKPPEEQLTDVVVNQPEPAQKLTPPSPEAGDTTKDIPGPDAEGTGAGSSVDSCVTKETVLQIDDATGEVTETTHVEIEMENLMKMIEKTADLQNVIDETGETTPLLPPLKEDTVTIFDRKAEKKVKSKKSMKESRRMTPSADRGAKPKKSTLDRESGESDEVAMPYSVFVKFMHQLKSELRTEIVKDVTKKTVRYVLKGLDGAVIQSVKGTSGVDPAVSTPPVSKGDATTNLDGASSHPIYYHEGIYCDACERVIVGVRYKCCNCVDFDLCEECEATHGIHDPDHVFLKIRKPARLRRSAPLFKTVIYRQKETTSNATPDSESTPEPHTPPIQDPVSEILKTKFEKIQEKTARKQERLRRKEEKLLHKQRRKEELLKRRLEMQRDEPLKRERLDAPLKRHVGMDASFLYDVNIPDGTKVQPGTKLLKTWRMKNTGSRPWNELTKLHLVYGSFPALNRHQDVEVPHLLPGEEADISVALMAPEKPGKYQSHWRMIQNGKQFGHRVWCLILVVPREVLEPTHDDPLKLVYDTIQGNTNNPDEVSQEPTYCDLLKVVYNKDESEADLPGQATEKSSEDPELFNYLKKTEELLTEKEKLVFKQEKAEEETEEVDDIEEDVEKNDIQDKVKVEQDLNTAAAAVAQLKLDQDQQPDARETGQDLMSFELLNLTARGSHKVSQTATPNNTPLDVTPPKSPAPELEDFKALSASSSVEVVNAEPGEPDHVSGQFVTDIMENLPPPKHDEADIESLKSFTDDDDDEDDSSLSEDDDFLIVPMPACFDFSKPVISRSIVDELSDYDDDEEEEVDDNHNRITTRGSSVDEMLTTSGPLTTPPLEPKPADSDSPVEDNIEEDVSQEVSATTPSEPPIVAATAAEMPQENDSEETTVMTVVSSAAGAAGVYDNTPSNTETGESSGIGEPEQGEVTQIKEPITEDVHSAEGGVASNQCDESENGATGQGPDTKDHSGPTGAPSDLFMNQVMATAVKAANKAASNAYTTCKEVFYTWQARAYQNGSGRQGNKYKPPPSTWKPKEKDQSESGTNQGSKYKPQQSTWKPKDEKYVPPLSEWKGPQDTWTPPQERWMPEKPSDPMTKLMEMGFCNRELNQKLLEKHEQNVEATIQELLSAADNDWMEKRH